jgi:hypothetical protein
MLTKSEGKGRREGGRRVNQELKIFGSERKEEGPRVQERKRKVKRETSNDRVIKQEEEEAREEGGGESEE